MMVLGNNGNIIILGRRRKSCYESSAMSSNEGWNIWFAGAFAGLSINLVIFPLDTLKTRLQSPSYCRIYKSPTAITNRTLYRGLYQGVGAIALTAIPSSGVFFTTYEGLKAALGSSWIPQPAVHAISSGIAQLVTSTVVTPAEVLKQNTQMLAQDKRDKRRNFPTLRVARQLIKHPAQLWRGYTALAARDLPFTVLQFPAYEHIKGFLIAWRSDHESAHTMLERAKISAASAGIAGCAAAWLTTPFDVAKTRMMLEAGARTQDEGGSRAGRVGGAYRRSGLQLFKEIFQNEGVRGLFRGGFVRAAYTIVGNGLYMGIYEGARFYLDNRAEKEDELGFYSQGTPDVEN